LNFHEKMNFGIEFNQRKTDMRSMDDHPDRPPFHPEVMKIITAELEACSMILPEPVAHRILIAILAAGISVAWVY
jgi:hypothetical protein